MKPCSEHPSADSTALEPLWTEAALLEPVASRPEFSADPGSRVAQRSFGQFPYISVQGNQVGSQDIFTVLVAAPILEGGVPETPPISLESLEGGLRCSVENVVCQISIQSDTPEVVWSDIS